MTGPVSPPRHVAVIDIGKTNAKLALVDMATLAEIAVITRPNAVLPGPPYPHVDVEGHWAFLLDGLGAFQRSYGVDAISVTTHGAAGALLAQDGSLAAPILDYEHDGPDALAADYARIKPPFALTGSPVLAGGLNLGAQLHYQLARDPGLRDRIAHVVTYPQFWGHRLTGIAACDVTSIGCHTDLWEPAAARLSPLAAALGLADRIAPVRRSGAVLGPVLPGIAARTGLAPGTPVACGIHDSNASLYPHILSRTAPFGVVSTGTWVVAMSFPEGGALPVLDPARDTLLNVDARGRPVPSARFMGGREFEIVSGGEGGAASTADLVRLSYGGPLLLPAVMPQTGPFRGMRARWLGAEPAPGTVMRQTALSAYLALMTAECLALNGASGDVIVEGPFARNAAYLAMLATATGRPVRAAGSATGTAIGAALLFATRAPSLVEGAPVLPEPALLRYITRWRAAVATAFVS